MNFNAVNVEQNMSTSNGYTRPAGAVTGYAAVQVGPKYRLGDVDSDGEITVKDALVILKNSLGIEQDVFDAEAADCDGDEKITAKDALLVLKHTLKLLSLDEMSLRDLSVSSEK